MRTKVKEFRCFNNIMECISYQEELNRKKLKMTKKQYSNKCRVYNCKNKAEVIIKTSFLKKLKRFFKFEFNYDYAIYCKNHIKEMCRCLRLEKDDFKQIKSKEVMGE